MKSQLFPTARSGTFLVAMLLAVLLPARAPGALARADASRRPAVAPDSGVPRISRAARAQLATARRATAELRTPEAAVAAGYRPMFGHVPLQGEHYVRTDLVAADSFDVARPLVLMFAPVDGTPTLVGVAYAYLHPIGAPPPVGFDGAADAWHSHERLARVPGRHLVMMHAWFVDAPGGPFARYNPWLPYYAAGLTPPAPSAPAAVSDIGARKLGLALAVAITPPMLFELVEARGGPAVRQRAATARLAITTLVPRLAAAERAGDRAAYARLAADVVRHGDALVQLHRDAAGDHALARRLVDRTVDEFLGRGHGVEEELEQLLRGGTRPGADRGAGHPGHHM
jgi:hypothetical protein